MTARGTAGGDPDADGTDAGTARTWARGSALAAPIADGLLVGGWLATRGLEDRPVLRRRLRVRITLAWSATVVAGELGWQLLAAPGHAADGVDRRTMRRLGVIALAETAVLWPLERVVPAALAARGVRSPHLVFGVAVGVLHAALEAPVYRAQAGGRRAALSASRAAPPWHPPVRDERAASGPAAGTGWSGAAHGRRGEGPRRRRRRSG